MDVPVLLQIGATKTLANGRLQQIHHGTTNANGAALLNAAFDTGGLYHYAVSIYTFEDVNNNQTPGGVGGAVITLADIEIAPTQESSSVLFTKVTATVQANATLSGGAITGDIGVHDKSNSTLKVAVVVECFSAGPPPTDS